MRRGATGALLACTLVSALLLTGCSDDPDPVEQPDPDAAATAPPAYDPSLEPAAAVLPYVPEDSTTLAVTDFEQLRLQLGVPTLTSEAPAGDRAAFWRKVDSRTAALTRGVLRPVEQRLARSYGFTQDDVLWEAHFGGGAQGWMLRLGDDVNMRRVRRAVEDGVGPLDGAQVADDEHLVGIGATSNRSDSWAAQPELTALVGTPAAATYVERSCIPFDDAYGPGMHDRLASGPAADVARLDELGPFAVAFGSDLVTARLGERRGDMFERARLGEKLPEGDPSFGAGFQRPVADPAGGRIGYAIGDPRIAVQLVSERRLPFAICAD